MKRVIRGQILVTPAGVDKVTDSFKPVDSDGNVIGLSVGEHYSRADLGSIYITVYQDSNKPIKNVPLTQLLPDGERQYYPLDEPFEIGKTVTVDLDSRSANCAAANPIVLICHHERV